MEAYSAMSELEYLAGRNTEWEFSGGAIISNKARAGTLYFQTLTVVKIYTTYAVSQQT